MKKSILSLCLLGCSAVASSYLTGACEPTKWASSKCMTSNNIYRGGPVNKDHCSSAIAHCGYCAVYKNSGGMTCYKKIDASGKFEQGIAWASSEDLDSYADSSLENCPCTNTYCTIVGA